MKPFRRSSSIPDPSCFEENRSLAIDTLRSLCHTEGGREHSRALRQLLDERAADKARIAELLGADQAPAAAARARFVQEHVIQMTMDKATATGFRRYEVTFETGKESRKSTLTWISSEESFDDAIDMAIAGRAGENGETMPGSTHLAQGE